MDIGGVQASGIIGLDDNYERKTHMYCIYWWFLTGSIYWGVQFSWGEPVTVSDYLCLLLGHRVTDQMVR